MEQPSIIWAWRAPKPAGTYVNFHTHDFYELVYYICGNGKTKIGERTYPFAAHEYVIIPPGVAHDDSHTVDGEVICLGFVGTKGLPMGWYQDGESVIYKLLSTLLTEVRRQRYGYQEMIGAKLTELCLQILRGEHTTAGEKNFEFVLNYIRENYQERILLSDCAAQLGLSYDYFHHRFKQLTGLSPRRYLLSTRLKAAKRMLRDGEKSCTEIAYLCGFSNSAQFSGLFSREYGCSPLQYRKNAESLKDCFLQKQ